MSKWPKTDKGWAAHVARMFKTIKPYRSGGHGLIDNPRFEAAFEGGYPDHPANAEEVIRHLRDMVRADRQLAELVLAHHRLDRSGIVGLAELAESVLIEAQGGAA